MNLMRNADDLLDLENLVELVPPLLTYALIHPNNAVQIAHTLQSLLRRNLKKNIDAARLSSKKNCSGKTPL